jgi:hypothetical protein
LEAVKMARLKKRIVVMILPLLPTFPQAVQEQLQKNEELTF